MAGYGGRRGASNVSQFLRELEENPSSLGDGSSFPALDDRDMSIFTNSVFFDYDTGQNTDFQPQPAKSDTDGQASRTTTDETMEDFSSLDFITGALFLPLTPLSRTVPLLPRLLLLSRSSRGREGDGRWSIVSRTPPGARGRHRPTGRGQCLSSKSVQEKKKRRGPSWAKETSFSYH